MMILRHHGVNPKSSPSQPVLPPVRNAGQLIPPEGGALWDIGVRTPRSGRVSPVYTGVCYCAAGGGSGERCTGSFSGCGAPTSGCRAVGGTASAAGGLG